MKRFIAAVALAACMLMGGCFAREQAPLPAQTPTADARQ